MNNNTNNHNRRQFLQNLGISLTALPHITALPSLNAHTPNQKPPQRLIIMFTPNGTLPNDFWPDTIHPHTPLTLKPILQPLQPYQNKILLLKGIHNKIRGDGDGHMRGMSCLLTATELNPGNIQGGSDTPAGWASGISIDQHIRNHLQKQPHTQTRFGSLEFGVAVPNRADPWTRMTYAGNNQPLTPIDDPAQMLHKLYGDNQNRAHLANITDHLRTDIQKIKKHIPPQDRTLLDQHLQHIRQLEQDIQHAQKQNTHTHPEPDIDPDIELTNDNTPQISRMQIDLLTSALANNLTHIATLQYMRSVGQARMRWLNIEDGHHTLSHKPDDDQQSYDKLKRINTWFAQQLAYLTQKLQQTPDPNQPNHSLLDNTQIIWVNELGKGNSHTLNNIPFLLIGNGANFKTNRALDLGGVPHNRLWLTLAHAYGDHQLKHFGTQKYSQDGPLNLA